MIDPVVIMIFLPWLVGRLLVEPAGWVFQGCLSIADGQGCEAR
jgi:hypothetical protein